MSDNVVPLGNVTRLDLPVKRVLEMAKEQLDSGCIVIGWDHDGEPYFASSIADGAEVIWLLELTKKKLLEIGE